MIKFIDKAFVGGQFFTRGMIAEFDAITEADLIADGDAVIYTVEATGTIDNAKSADFAVNAQNAVNALNAQTAVTAQNAIVAQSATTASTATSATTATSAATATNATNAVNAAHADTADTASTATHATTATTATHAATSDAATSAEGVLVNDSTQTAYPELTKVVEVLGSSAEARSCASTGVDEVLDSFKIKAGDIGPNSIIQIEPLWTYTNSANNKILRVKFAGINVYNVTRTLSVKEAPLIILANRNSLSSQIQVLDSNYIIGGANAPLTFSIDFNFDVTVDITGQRASSGDTLKLEYFRVLHFLGD